MKVFAVESWKSLQLQLKVSDIHFWPKANIQNSAYRKLFSLKGSRKLLCLYFQQIFDKGFEVIRNIKILRFEGNWDELRAMIWLAKSKKMKQNWTRPENLNVCFCGSFDHYCQKLLLLLLLLLLFFFFSGGEGAGETGHWAMPTPNFENFFSFLIFLKSSVLSLKLFSNSWSKSQAKFIILDIKFRSNFGELNFHGNSVNCRNMSLIVDAIKYFP